MGFENIKIIVSSIKMTIFSQFSCKNHKNYANLIFNAISVNLK